MSMMGEMKFFLGFEIKQLREGTFINQAKYLQDMLKRFKMTELKGVATPMVTKCHLALDPNGTSKKRNKGPVDEIEEELEQTRPSKLTARQQAAQRHKSPAVRGKNIHVSVKNMQYHEYKELHDMNPYLTPRSNRVGDKRFHNKTQEEIFYEVYVPFKKGVAPQHAIDTAKRAASRYFEEAYAMCGEFGLYPIMELNKDYDIGLIHQFYATVHFEQDEVRTFRWMTHERFLESNLAKFGSALGYPRYPGVNANGWRCHDSSFAQTREVLEHLYIKGSEDQAPQLPHRRCSPMDEKPPIWASKLARRMRQFFCLTSAVNHRQYQQHAEAKKSRVRQKSIMRALEVEVSPPGSEENITPEAEWVSRHGVPLPPDGLEIESPPHTPPYPGAPSNLPPGWANADPWGV
ncbi:hypothetical protein QYE76_014853 [Lolium multiflorum]|uniref:Reverse transcriptase Ty1/copia-type domain-containing protein n=1 Tax=Lolium multiflorum TaxID=4521 RepID=A0AAD8U3A1_LOLMU|nr:hypothetical protein QYE76_014853 [Lolium multiflorum]